MVLKMNLNFLLVAYILPVSFRDVVLITYALSQE